MSIDITTLALAKEYTNRMVGSGGTGGGVDGKDGITPHIGDNGNWFIGTVDTGISAQGPAGENGVTPHIGTNGNWYIGSVNTGVSAKGAKGDNGLDGNGIKSAILNSDYTLTLTFDDGTTYTTPSIRGATGSSGKDGPAGAAGKDGTDGVGIASIEQTATSTADGGNNVFTVTLTNGTTATFTVKNGSKGSTGKDGSNGVDGGHYTPVVTQPTTDTMQISFAPSKPDMPAVNTVTVNLPVSENSGQNVNQMEPAEDDIPKVFFVGTTPTTKAEDELPLTMEYISKSKRFFAYATLKVQGDSSAGYPVKNFNLKMFSDEARSEKLKMQFRNWTAKTHKFCLKKNWIDVLNVRNVVNGRLWGQVVRTRADYDNYPAEYRESSNCGAVDGFPIKLYVNGVYQGLYTWNIRKDDSMFGMDDSTGTHAALIADSSNNAVLWRALPNIDGTDWTDELNDVTPDAVVTGFRNAVNFVMTASDDDFEANIEQYFYKSSLTDYYAFIYAIQMVGGLGKSQTMFTYDATRFFANIYDMDTTWALAWNGAGFYPTDMTCPEGYMQISGDGVSNLLYERFVAAFQDDIRERYFELRHGPLSTANIINEFERFSDPIVAAGLYAEEIASTTAYGTSRPSKDTNTIQRLRQIITERLAYVDEQMAKLRPPVVATSITLSASELAFTSKEPQTLMATVEPVDTTDSVQWSVSPAGIVVVKDGVVTPIGDGACTVTATCGAYSASCTVTVSLPQTAVPIAEYLASVPGDIEGEWQDIKGGTSITLNGGTFVDGAYQTNGKNEYAVLPLTNAKTVKLHVHVPAVIVGAPGGGNLVDCRTDSIAYILLYNGSDYLGPDATYYVGIEQMDIVGGASAYFSEDEWHDITVIFNEPFSGDMCIGGRKGYETTSMCAKLKVESIEVYDIGVAP